MTNETARDDRDFMIYKSDSEKRLVFGWASISIDLDGEQLKDLQQDMIDPEDLEEAAYTYVLNFRDTGEEHIPSMRKKGRLVESCVLTEEKQRAMGIPPGIVPVGWWIGFKIEDDDAWERVKNGTYRMFSIEGKANRVPVEKSREITGCGVLVLRDGKVLTGTRIERASRGQICGPGGHIEDGETPAEAAIREAQEEFGISCDSLESLGVQDGGKRYGKAEIFLCRAFSGTPKTDETEMTGVRWLDPAEIEEEGTFPPFYHSLALLPKTGVAKSFFDILKFNPYHGPDGRFASADGYSSFTFRTRDPSRQGMADRAIARERERQAGGGANPNKDPAEIAGVKRGAPMSHQQADEGRANPQYAMTGEARKKLEDANKKLSNAIYNDASAEEKAQARRELDQASQEYNQAIRDNRPYTVNCQTCVVAYELRRRGYDVEARGNDGKIKEQQALSRGAETAWIDPATGEMPMPLSNAPTVRTAKQAQKWLEQNLEPGGRYEFAHGWKGTNGRTGHIVTAEKAQDGSVSLFDPQTGTRYTGDAYTEYMSRVKPTYSSRAWSGDYRSREKSVLRGRLELLRVDNLQINPTVANAVLKGAGE